MTTPDAKNARAIAAVDLGSNSFHLVIGRRTDEGITLVDSLRDPVRLAAGLDENGGLGEDGELEEEVVARALACLARFGQRLAHIPPGHVRAVGTQTLRLAGRAGGFVERAEQALGVPVEILSGTEEGRLIYLGVAHDIAHGAGRRLVVDIGGGSTECIVGEKPGADVICSLAMGCVSWSRRFFPDGRLLAERFRRARMAARLDLAGQRRRLLEAGWDECVGSSGTIRALVECQDGLGLGRRLCRAGLERIERELVDRGSVERADLAGVKLAGIKPDRAPVLPGGLAILQAVFEGLEIDSMVASKAALREGLLWDLRQRLRSESVRDRSVSVFVERYGVERDQARRVSATALACFAQTARAWELDTELGRAFLSWAAQLHEVGLAIAHSGYHKHGEYILANSDMPGFSWEDQRLLATLVRSHRKKLLPARFDELAPGLRAPGLRLCVLLRLAVRLHRSRSPQPLPEFELRAAGSELELRFPTGWLDAHPLTRTDLEQEAALLSSAGFRLLAE